MKARYTWKAGSTFHECVMVQTSVIHDAEKKPSSMASRKYCYIGKVDNFPWIILLITTN